MLNIIGIGSLAEAYGLNVFQCIDLVKKVDCWSAEDEKIPSSCFDSFEEDSRYYTEKLVSDPDAAVRMMRAAAIGWRKPSSSGFIESEIQRYRDFYNRGFKGQRWVDPTAKDYALRILHPLVCTSLICQFSVDKKQAVLLLDEEGFPLVQEVMGLTKYTVDKFLAKSVEDASNAPPVSPVSTGSNRDSDKYIPRELWAQKPLEQVCDDMRVAGFEDEAIAYALFNWRNIKNMTALGTLFKGKGITDSGRAKYARKILKKAGDHYYTD